MISNNEAFTYQPSNQQAMCFTVKILGSAVEGTIDDYKCNILHTWARLPGVTLLEPWYERDSVGRLHMHGILYCRKGYFKRKLSVPGYYVYVTDCYDLEHWIEYCTKGQAEDHDRTQPQDETAAQLVAACDKINNTLFLF